MLSRNLNAAKSHPSVEGERDEIGDELADHLECSTHVLKESGLSDGEAEIESRNRFGNVNEVRRELLWINHGDHIMAQRFMWAALLVLFVSMAGLFWNQQRNTAELTAAIKSLTSQISKDAPYRETLTFRVTDLAGKPKAGFLFSVVATAGSRSPEFHSRELTTGPDGTVESLDVPEGDYRVVREIKGKNWSAYIEGPEIRVRAQKHNPRLDLELPDLVPVSLSFQLPKIEHWMANTWFSLSGHRNFRNSNIRWMANCKIGEPCLVNIPEAINVGCSYEFRRNATFNEGSVTQFQAFEAVWPADALPKSGAEFLLGPPRDSSNLLTEAGTIRPLSENEVEKP